MAINTFYKLKLPMQIQDFIIAISNLILILTFIFYPTLQTKVHKSWVVCEDMLGARVRHSAHGKGHEEGGSTYAKAGLSLRSPPGNPRASTPITSACLLYYFVLQSRCSVVTYTSDFTGGCHPPPLSEKELT